MSSLLPPLASIPHDIVSVNDYRPYAQQRVTEQAWAYFSGGAGNERCLQRNEQAFQRLSLLPKLLAQDFSHANTHCSLLGHELPYPILLAPVAYQKLAHRDGELATVLAASAMQSLFVLSMQASVGVTEVAQAAHGPLWFQWYPQADAVAAKALLNTVEAAGYQAIVFTIDAPVNGMRYREQRSGFVLPDNVQAVNLQGFQGAASVMGAPGGSPLFATALLECAATWDTLAQFIHSTSLPVLVKGVLRGSDAEKAIQCGAAGIIVSNHGGRILDALPASLTMLPEVAQVVNKRVPVLFDGGIRTGSDIATAIALGAQAVLIGKPYIYALAAAGAPGVAHVLHMLRTELEVCMALLGAVSLSDLTPDLVRYE